MAVASQMARPTCNDRSQVDRMARVAVVKQTLTTAPPRSLPTVKQKLTVARTNNVAALKVEAVRGAKPKAARKGRGDQA
jgi:hypothetical protein